MRQLIHAATLVLLIFATLCLNLAEVNSAKGIHMGAGELTTIETSKITNTNLFNNDGRSSRQTCSCTLAIVIVVALAQLKSLLTVSIISLQLVPPPNLSDIRSKLNPLMEVPSRYLP